MSLLAPRLLGRHVGVPRIEPVWVGCASSSKAWARSKSTTFTHAAGRFEPLDLRLPNDRRGPEGHAAGLDALIPRLAPRSSGQGGHVRNAANYAMKRAAQTFDRLDPTVRWAASRRESRRACRRGFGDQSSGGVPGPGRAKSAENHDRGRAVACRSERRGTVGEHIGVGQRAEPCVTRGAGRHRCRSNGCRLLMRRDPPLPAWSPLI